MRRGRCCDHHAVAHLEERLSARNNFDRGILTVDDRQPVFAESVCARLKLMHLENCKLNYKTINPADSSVNQMLNQAMDNSAEQKLADPPFP